ncbi:MAG: PAS domain S-box protein [Deltaproteobacteria bacterium]|nr:PAS domain S-box protein [Deltaproteobacteria bacterium]
MKDELRNNFEPVEDVSTSNQKIKELEPSESEHKWAQGALTKSEEKFRKAFYISPDSISITRLEDGMYVSINPEFTRILGYTEEEIIEKTSIEYNIWDNIEDRQRLVDGLKKDGEVNNLEAALRAKVGDIVQGLMSASIIDLDGVPHILSITRDITARKRAKSEREDALGALRESEEKYRFLVEQMKDTVWTADISMKPTYVSQSSTNNLGFTPEERVRQDLSEMVTPETYSKIVDVLARELEKEQEGTADPDRSIAIEMEYYHKDGHTLWLENRIHAIRNNDGRPVGFHGVSRDITKRKKAEEDLKETLENLRKALGAIVQVMVLAMETRDPYTAGHQLRVADLARAIATEMGLPKDKIEEIRIASSIHDMGKLSIPAEILSKTAKLSELEFSMIKEHPMKGYKFLKDIKHFQHLGEIVYQHHERMDGSGYPRNLKGDDILIEARILAVSDVVEAMSSHRPYRAALGIDAALEEIEKNRGTLYDNDATDAGLRLFREKGYQL